VIELKIGDCLFHHGGIGTVLKYFVYEIRNIVDNTFYAIKCDSCNHSDACSVLIGLSDYRAARERNEYKFICMIGDEESREEHYCFHNEKPYFLTEKECIIFSVERFMGAYATEADELKKKYEGKIKEYERLKTYIDLLMTDEKEKTDELD